MIHNLFQKCSKVKSFGLSAPEMDWCKGHLKEVEPKGLHEEEESKERRENASNIWEHINERQVSSVNGSGNSRPLNPKISVNLIRIGNSCSRLEGLRTKAGLSGDISNRSQTFVSVEHVFIHVYHIVVPSSITQIHVISLEKILESWRVLRVYDRTQLINC